MNYIKFYSISLFLTAFILLIANHLAFPQTCPPGDYSLDSQAEVNAFPSTCTTVIGDLSISGSDITDLTPLSNLTSIGGSLLIQQNTSLTSLDGLDGITSVGNVLTLYDNPVLPDVDGLSGLTSVGGVPSVGLMMARNHVLSDLGGFSSLTSITGALFINDCDALENLQGFNSLTTIGGRLTIINNDNLEKLKGLQGLNSVGGIHIGNNPVLVNINQLTGISSGVEFIKINHNQSLTNLNGLSGISSVTGNVNIHSNDDLGSCCGIYDLLNTSGAIGGSINIYNNNTGCDNVTEINTNCGSARMGVQAAAPELSLFPNPSAGKVVLQWEIVNDEPVVLTIYDQLGRMLMQQRPMAGDRELKVDLSSAEFPAGLYYVQLAASSGRVTQALQLSK
ncbi:MAG: T9SS type A sorting domain-containing protein [Bacteroidetes bacterium]|nr:T9SS type A sorting domain-containing protein [Bacteroidota bacterium]